MTSVPESKEGAVIEAAEGVPRRVYFHRGLNDAVPLNGGWYLLTSAFVVGECSSRCGTPPGECIYIEVE